jgi:hypothetical protein
LQRNAPGKLLYLVLPCFAILCATESPRLRASRYVQAIAQRAIGQRSIRQHSIVLFTRDRMSPMSDKTSHDATSHTATCDDSANRPAPDCSILLPHCETSTCTADVIAQLAVAATQAGLTAEYLAIDNGTAGPLASGPASLDLARHALDQPNSRLLRFEQPVGLGAAWAAGISAARSDIIVAWQASQCYSPDDLPRLVARLARADVICGRRRRTWIARQARRVGLWPRHLLMGSFSDASMDAGVLDPRSPVWAARREAVAGLPLELGLEAWLATLVARRGFRVCELNIDFDAAHAEGSLAGTFAPHFAELLAARHICRQPLFNKAIEVIDGADTLPTSRTNPSATTRDGAASLPGPWLAAEFQPGHQREDRAA